MLLQQAGQGHLLAKARDGNAVDEQQNTIVLVQVSWLSRYACDTTP